MAAGSRRGAASAGRKLAGARSRNRAVDGIKKTAALFTGRRAHELEAGAARSVDQQGGISAGPARRADHRLLADLREINVAKDGGDGGKFGARERAKGTEIGNFELAFEGALAGKTVE